MVGGSIFGNFPVVKLQHDQRTLRRDGSANCRNCKLNTHIAHVQCPDACAKARASTRTLARVVIFALRDAYAISIEVLPTPTSPRQTIFVFTSLRGEEPPPPGE